MPVTEPPTSAPASLSFERRRWTALFSLPFAVVLALGGLVSLAWLPQVLGARLGLTLAVLAVLASFALAAAIGRSAWQALSSTGPALVVDARGITDRFHLHTHLPWPVIESATVDHGEGNDLMLVLRPGTRLPQGGEVKPTLLRRLRRLFSGGDVRIPLGGLVVDHRRLRDALKAHLALQTQQAGPQGRHHPRGDTR